MSLAIGTWLYDSSSDYSVSSKNLNQAMLAAMSSTSSEMPNLMNNSKNKFDVDPKKDENKKKPIKANNKIPEEYMWVLK